MPAFKFFQINEEDSTYGTCLPVGRRSEHKLNVRTHPARGGVITEGLDYEINYCDDTAS